jgi:SAM-dependent methyltransferase
MGERLGLYRAMASSGPMTAPELAKMTRTDERYVQEWLNAQAAGGYVSYDASHGRYFLTEEQAFALADESSPAYCLGGFQVALAALRDMPKITEVFRSGKGFGWHEHDHELFEGTERFFRSSYNGNLLTSWLPALDGVEEKLRKGARVADVGCGHGASTILMAKAYPDSEFVGFDYHEGSVAKAREAAKKAGLNGNARFETAAAKTFPGKDYDLVAFFDCLHDMGDPVGASRHVRESLAADGTWMIVEPFANDRVEDNLTPVGRVYYAASTLVCTPCSKAQEVGAALGAQAGEKRLTSVLAEGGFTRIRRAAETPFNLVLEARP